MYFIVSIALLVLWAASGLERIEILVASIIFAVLYIPENYVNQKFKNLDRAMKQTINGIFGTGRKKEEK